MEDMLSKLRERCMAHLSEISEYAEAHGGFKCPSQVDDMKDLLVSVKCIDKILSKEKSI